MFALYVVLRVLNCFDLQNWISIVFVYIKKCEAVK